MRNAFFLLFMAEIFLFGSCQDLSTQPSDRYDFMLFERIGAGSLKFNVYPLTSVYAVPLISVNAIEILVTRHQFRDTTIQMVVFGGASNAATFEALKKALSGQIQITGDFKESPLPVGTWVRIYMVKGSQDEVVTNTDLRNRLMSFEQIVRGKL